MSKKPDYILKMKDPKTGFSNMAGAGWKTRVGGGINIRLNFGQAVQTDTGGSLTLWPNEPKPNANFGGDRGFSGPSGGDEVAKSSEGDEDIPW